MVKLADTLDLDSSDEESWGFKSLYPHHKKKQKKAKKLKLSIVIIKNLYHI